MSKNKEDQVLSVSDAWAGRTASKPAVPQIPQINAEKDGVLVSSDKRHRVAFYIQKKKGDPKMVTNHLTLGAGKKLIDGSEFEWKDSHPIDGKEYTLVVENIDEMDQAITGERVEFKGPIKTDESPTPPAPLEPPTPPADDTPANDGGSKSPSDSTAVKQAANQLRKIIGDQRRALEKHNRDGSMPAWMDEAKLRNMANTTKEIFDQHPGDKTIEVLSRLILTNGKSIQKALANASAPAPAKQKPEPKPAPPLEPKLDHATIADRVEDLEDNVEEIKGGLAEVRAGLDKKASEKDLEGVKKDLGQKIDEGFGVVGKQIANLNKPATDPKSGASGNGGNNGGSGASDGGKASASSPGPYYAGHGLTGLLIGLGAMFVLGLIVLCTHLMSKGPSAGFMPAMVPPVIMITNTVTPPAVQQAVLTPTTTSSPEDLAKIADEMKAIRAGQAEFLRKEGGYSANGTQPKGGRVPTIAVGDNSIVAGRDVTVVNHNFSSLPPGKPVEEVSSGPTVTPSANATSGTFGVFTEIRSSNTRQEFPVDPALFELEFNRRIGMPDRWRYHY